jgi:hypothetical protein
MLAQVVALPNQASETGFISEAFGNRPIAALQKIA